MNPLLTIIGPTASGKTALAVQVAARLNGEIISGDSRQVYRGMDIGTGKDLCEYTLESGDIPYHLIDIRPAGDKYNLFEYQHDFNRVLLDIQKREKQPILCGGTGLYIEAVLKGYTLQAVPENQELRRKLKDYTLEELATILGAYGSIHNKTDLDTCARAIRAIEIADYQQTHSVESLHYKKHKSITIALDLDRELRRERISIRLRERLECGMIDEVRQLLASGIEPDDLIYYGLEYKYLTLYLIGRMGYQEMIESLEIAIHQFAKRQMTWFRGMERRKIPLHWIDASAPIDEKVEQILCLFQQPEHPW